MTRHIAPSILASLFAFAVFAAEPPTADPASATAPGPVVVVGEAVGIVNGATVVAVDLKGHTLTLTGPSGRRQTYKVSRKVDLGRLSLGDVVFVESMEAVAVSVRGPNAGPAGTAAEGNGAPGTKEVIQLTAKVTKVGRNPPAITVVGPAGGKVVVKAKDASGLTGIKVGDQVDVTFTQAVVLALRGPGASATARK